MNGFVTFYTLINSSTFQEIIKLNFGRLVFRNYLINNSSSVRLYDGPDIMLFSFVAWGRSFYVYCWVSQDTTDDLLLQISSGVVGRLRDLPVSQDVFLTSPRLCCIKVRNSVLFFTVNVLFHFRN